MKRLQPPPGATILEVLSHRAAQSPDALAFSVDGDEITYAALQEDVRRLAAALAAGGLRRGATCALVLPTGLDFIRGLFATQTVGAVPAAVNMHMPPELIERRLEIIRCELALVDDHLADELRAAGSASSRAASSAGGTRIEAMRDLAGAPPSDLLPADPVAPDEIAYLQFTSGTSGDPRAAMLPHRNLMLWLRASLDLIEVTDEDVLVSWAPLHHILGLARFVCAPIYFGRPVYLLQPSIASLPDWLKTIARVRGTITASPDFGYRIAAEMVDPDSLDLSCLRFAINGGESVRLSTIERFEQRFGLKNVVRPGYGLSEAMVGVAVARPGEPLRTDENGAISCGRVTEYLEAKVVDEAGRAVPAGQQGEILIRGEPVFPGYFENEQATRRVLRDGWLHTGDIGWFDEDGYLYICGRKRAMIKRAGAMLIPLEFEEAANRVDGVDWSAAIGRPQEAIGGTEEVVVVAEVRPERIPTEAAAAAMAQAVGAEVTRAMGIAPADVYLVAPRTIPRTHNGKTRHTELRRRILAGELAAHDSILYPSGAAE